MLKIGIRTTLLKEISQNKINIIFCDEKHNPFSELSSFYLSYHTSKKIIEQSKWQRKIKDMVWQKIISNKIKNQALLLKKIKSESYHILIEYESEVTIGDKTNREGHAAKIYFNALFGKKFSRKNDDIINSALNYGYAILLSTFNKEIVSNGYITQLGINHHNEFNNFNLSCDFMEPFRIVIDEFVYYNLPKEFNTEYKMNLVNILNKTYIFNKRNYTLKDIIKNYVKQVLDCIGQEKEYKDFIIYER